MSFKTLSIAPYYGGKGRIAHFLTDRFDYKNTEIYVSAFGGMCRDLLNKPRHKYEIYNDFNVGLCTLMHVLSKPDTAKEMIKQLYYETEFSRDCFDKFKAIYDRTEMDIVEWEKRGLVNLICSCLQQPQKGRDNRKAIAEEVFDKLLYESGRNNLLPVNQHKRRIDPAVVLDAYEHFLKCIHTDKRIEEATDAHFENIDKIVDMKQDGIIPPSGADLDDFSDIELAMATFIVFTMSYYGQGRNFNSRRFKSQEEYKQRVLRLHECAERMEGVYVANTDTMSFFTNVLGEKVKTNINGKVRDKYKIICPWLYNPNVMMYCDPSYISPDDEQELLKGIDLENAEILSDAIEKKYGNNQVGKYGNCMPKNLGSVYSCSFGYEEQEEFLELIHDATCKLMVSNYDLVLYNKYLNEKNGWQRREIETFTAIGGKAGNKRKEVIWFNY